MLNNTSIVNVEVLKKKTLNAETNTQSTIDVVYKQHQYDCYFGALNLLLQDYLPKGYQVVNKDTAHIPLPIGYKYLSIDKSGVVMVSIYHPINSKGYLFPVPGTKYKLLGRLYLKTDVTKTEIFKQDEVIVIEMPTLL